VLQHALSGGRRLAETDPDRRLADLGCFASGEWRADEHHRLLLLAAEQTD